MKTFIMQNGRKIVFAMFVLAFSGLFVDTFFDMARIVSSFILGGTVAVGISAARLATKVREAEDLK